MYKVERWCDKVSNIEAYLNEMEAEGWKVINCSFFYDHRTFREDRVSINILLWKNGKGNTERKRGLIGKMFDSLNTTDEGEKYEK